MFAYFGFCLDCGKLYKITKNQENLSSNLVAHR